MCGLGYGAFREAVAVAILHRLDTVGLLMEASRDTGNQQDKSQTLLTSSRPYRPQRLDLETIDPLNPKPQTLNPKP